MSISHQLLETLGSTQPSISQPAPLTLHLAQARLEVLLTAANELGLQFQSLTFSYTPAVHWTGEKWQAVADQLVEKVTYLTERLRLIEWDQAAAMLQLRSVTPQRRGQDLSYYEIFISAHQGVLTLRRFHVAADQTDRQAVPYTLTNEQVDQLVQDLASM